MTLLTDLLRLALAFVVIAGVGWGVARAWGGRGAGAALAAVPTSWGLMAGLAALGAVTPIRFTVLASVLCVAGAGLLGLAVSRLRRRVHLSRDPAARTDADGPLLGLDVLAGVGVMTLIVFGVYAAATNGNLEMAPQSYDTASHVNVVRHVAETGIGDPWHATAFINGAARASEYYPVSFIAMGATVMRIVGSDSVVAANLCAILLAGALWPSTITILSRAILGRTRTVTWCSLAVSLMTFGMPWAPLSWGVLWTTAAGAAAVPMVIAGLAGLVGLTERPMRWTAATTWLVGGATLTALGHPRVLILLVPIAIPALVWGVWNAADDWRHGSEQDRRMLRERTVAILVLSALAAVSFWLVWRWSTTTNKVSLPGFVFHETFVGDLKNQFTGSPAHSFPNYVGAALAAAGMVVVLHRRIRRWGWLVLGWWFTILVDAATVGLTWDWVLETMQWWYGDRFRTATVVSVCSVPLATLGALAVWNRTTSWRTRVGIAAGSRRAKVAAVAVTALALALGSDQSTGAIRALYKKFSYNTTTALVSPPEVGFMQAVGDKVGDDGYVLNNPFDGSALLYAYTGSTPVFYHLNRASATPYGRELAKVLRFETDHARVCTMLRRANIKWVMSLGTATFHGSPYERSPALELDGPTWFSEPVLTEGDYRLSRVTCPE